MKRKQILHFLEIKSNDLFVNTLFTLVLILLHFNEFIFYLMMRMVDYSFIITSNTIGNVAFLPHDIICNMIYFMETADIALQLIRQLLCCGLEYYCLVDICFSWLFVLRLRGWRYSYRLASYQKFHLWNWHTGRKSKTYSWKQSHYSTYLHGVWYDKIYIIHAPHVYCYKIDFTIKLGWFTM